MFELFDTTEIRQVEALRRRVTAADAAGQGDLFAVEALVEVDSPFAWPTAVGVLFTREDAEGAMMLA
ncbi:hypothetical protein [Actinokineospora sp.]|uniref:hypothetical protein n=1 Tax=Actinokineospora sp. TaxID=1872133 RepID=UPI003D6A0C83